MKWAKVNKRQGRRLLRRPCLFPDRRSAVSRPAAEHVAFVRKSQGSCPLPCDARLSDGLRDGAGVETGMGRAVCRYVKGCLPWMGERQGCRWQYPLGSAGIYCLQVGMVFACCSKAPFRPAKRALLSGERGLFIRRKDLFCCMLRKRLIVNGLSSCRQEAGKGGYRDISTPWQRV